MPQTNNLNEPPEQCPTCNAESLNHQAAIESWICEECGYVLDSGSQPLVSDTSRPDEEETEDETQQVNWESQIAVTDDSEVNLIEALSQTETVADAVGLSKERTLRAGEVIAKAWQTNFMHGRSQDRTIGAVIYAVSRGTNTALPPAMIAEELPVDKAAIKQMFQKLNLELELDIGPPIPSEFIPVIRETLELSGDIESTAKDILQQRDSSGGNPIGIAAAAVYISCDQNETELTLKQLAEVTGLTKETIWRQKEKLVN